MSRNEILGHSHWAAPRFVSWVVVAPLEEPDIPTELDLVRMQLGQLAVPSEALTIPPDRRDQIAARRVPLPTDEVIFYRVDSIR